MRQVLARRVAIVASLAALLMAPMAGLPASSAAPPPSPPPPVELDVRGPHGVPKAAAPHAPSPEREAALAALEREVGAAVQVRYNGLTSTPRYLFSYAGYLSAPSGEAPGAAARAFLGRHAAIFGFSESDLEGLRLRSRATVPDIATTILLFQQEIGGTPVYKGEVLVNVDARGRVVSAGGESFPALRVEGAERLTPARALSAAAASVGVRGFRARPAGTDQVPQTFGDLPPRFVAAPRFEGGAFGADVVVTRTLFPFGARARRAYELVLETPWYEGFAWKHVIDAETGRVLRRVSLTSHQSGGGQGVGRYGTLRPDLQDRVESHNAARTATLKAFDTAPTILTGRRGFGRASAGLPPRYADESATSRNSGRGFKLSQALARNEFPLRYQVPLGQAVRGAPDAANPSAESPFGWFYLPTDTGGGEITGGNSNHASTRAYGYTMSAEARTRNVAENSPAADRGQPFSATLAPLPAPVTLPDGRVLGAVFESQYTEGNNAVVSDDQAGDERVTHGIKGWAPGRQFKAPHFDFVNGYGYGRTDAGGTPFIPTTARPDTYPGAATAFLYANLLHDYLYSIGFTEPLWNFQQDNFGRGGAGSDGLTVEIQDGGGTDNATMRTDADGRPSRMQMFLATQGSFRRADGAFDFDVVAHEFYHGVSNRSAAKGGNDCLGLALTGESGGQGEGWSDYIAASMTDDDAVGEFFTGELDVAIRRLPLTNYRWSYGSLNGNVLLRRDRGGADTTPFTVEIPFEVHSIGELWSAVLWDMRELLIVKEGGTFFDGSRRLGSGTSYYVGPRRVASVDSAHPIDYRAAFNTNDAASIKAAEHIVRPGLVAAEIAARGDRRGPLATAVANGARLADTLVLRGLQLGLCYPSFLDSRDAILLADRELTGGESQAIIWRAFASHGAGLLAQSTTLDNPATDQVPVAVEDYNVPVTVRHCEVVGPLSAPGFTASAQSRAVRLTINGGTPVAGASHYVVSRSDGGPFRRIAEVPADRTVLLDEGLEAARTYSYQVRASRAADFACVSTANTRSVTLP